jgi:hypothetical protein
MILVPPVDWTLPDDVLSTSVVGDEKSPYGMFVMDQSLVTWDTADIVATATPGEPFDTILLYNVGADSVTVELLDGPSAWSETVNLLHADPISDAFPNRQRLALYCPYTDPAAYPGAAIRVTIAATDRVRFCGTVLVGVRTQIGETLYGSSVGITDYSRKERDVFGDVILIERGYSDRVNYRMLLATAEVAQVRTLLASRRARLTAYIGSNQHPETIVLGYYQDFTIPIEGHEVTVGTLEVSSVVNDSTRDFSTLAAVFATISASECTYEGGFKTVYAPDGAIDSVVQVALLDHPLQAGESVRWHVRTIDGRKTGLSGTSTVAAACGDVAVWEWPASAVTNQGDWTAAISATLTLADLTKIRSTEAILTVRRIDPGAGDCYPTGLYWADPETGAFDATALTGELASDVPVTELVDTLTISGAARSLQFFYVDCADTGGQIAVAVTLSLTGGTGDAKARASWTSLTSCSSEVVLDGDPVTVRRLMSRTALLIAVVTDDGYTDAVLSATVQWAAPLTSGVGVSVSGALDEEQYYLVNASPDAGQYVSEVSLALTGGTGNADLYAAWGAPATTGSSLASTNPDNEESLPGLSSAGHAYLTVLVHGAAAFSGATLTATTTLADCLVDGAAEVISGEALSSQTFWIELPELSGDFVNRIVIDVTGELELYASYDCFPSAAAAPYASTTGQLIVPWDGRSAALRIRVHSLQAYTSESLTATLEYGYPFAPQAPVGVADLGLPKGPGIWRARVDGACGGTVTWTWDYSTTDELRFAPNIMASGAQLIVSAPIMPCYPALLPISQGTLTAYATVQCPGITQTKGPITLQLSRTTDCTLPACIDPCPIDPPPDPGGDYMEIFFTLAQPETVNLRIVLAGPYSSMSNDFGDGFIDVELNADGFPINSAQMQHTYAAAGNYSIKVRCENAQLGYFRRLVGGVSGNFRGVTSVVFNTAATFNYTHGSVFIYQENLESVSGDFIVASGQLDDLFKGCGITSIPEGFFDHVGLDIWRYISLCYDCTQLTTVPANLFDHVPPHSSFHFAFHNCALTQASVDNILVSLDTALGDGNDAWSHVEIHLNGGTSAAPSAVGLAAKANLEARNWTVYHN